MGSKKCNQVLAENSTFFLFPHIISGIFGGQNVVRFGIFFMVFCLLVPQHSLALFESAKLEMAGSVKYAARPLGPQFRSLASDQGVGEQPISDAAYSYNQASLGAALLWQNDISVHGAVDYVWDTLPLGNSFQLTQEKAHIFYLRDLFFRFPLGSSYHLWLGARKIEYPKIELFNFDNPFTQEFVGLGLESAALRISLSLDFFRPEKSTTLQISNRFLLGAGYIFEPIFSFRYYFATPLNAARKNKFSNTTGFLAGGIFSRPFSAGHKGETSFWFQNLPANAQTPQNILGLSENSEFYLRHSWGLITALVATNNSYRNSQQVLTASPDRQSLLATNRTVDVVNRASLGVQLVYFLLQKMHLALDVNGIASDVKVLPEDANALILTPLLRYTLEENTLNSKKYAFLSFSYGIYDWKIKRNIYGIKTDQALSMQLGVSYTL